MRKSILAFIALLTLLGGSAMMVTFTPYSSVALADDDCDSSGSGSGNCDDRDDDHGGHGGDDDQDDHAASTALALPVGQREIRIIDEQYVPNTITVQVGETVTFVNADDDEHTATGPGFDTGTMQPGQSVTVSFDTAGSFDFACQFHPEMRGTVIVEGSGTPIASPVASPIASPAAATTGAQVEMSILDFSFEQPALTVPPGTTVTWTNNGASPHTVTGLPTDSPTIEPGQSFSFTFDSVGTYEYGCAFHPQMKGSVVVDANAPLPGS